MGKEGVERYRVYNLPKICSCPGVYEIGIAIMIAKGRHESHKLDSDRVVVVYVGQADNVRTRLQQYGRHGAHLESGSGLFTDIFSRGYSVAFRWAPMKSKADAERTETQLLGMFDYAWNKESNGVRRAEDVLQKLYKISSSTIWLPKLVRRLQTLSQKQVGVRIKAIDPVSPMHEPYVDTDHNGNHLFSRIFKFGRSQPRQVSARSDLNGECPSICGVPLDDTSFCEKSAIKGRKRCAEHKGMRIHGTVSMLIPERRPNVLKNCSDSDLVLDKYLLGHEKANLPPLADMCTDNEASAPTNDWDCEDIPTEPGRRLNQEFYIMCGVDLGNNVLCERQPNKGRKRCEEHKGMKLSKARAADIKSYCSSFICGVNLGNGFVCEETPLKGRKRCKEHKGMRVVAHTTSCSNGRADSSSLCGAATEDGSCCCNRPVKGNKRCSQHKGRRAASFFTGSPKESLPFCGVTLLDGSTCSRMPAYGRKRCEQHKGMKVET